jgi:hypothetical protein
MPAPNAAAQLLGRLHLLEAPSATDRELPPLPRIPRGEVVILSAFEAVLAALYNEARGSRIELLDHLL